MNKVKKMFIPRLISTALTVLLLAGMLLLPVAAQEKSLDRDTDITLEEGQLIITETPTFQFGFDLSVFSEKDNRFGASSPGIITGQFVVEDGRGLDRGNWTLQVSLGKFTRVGGSSSTLGEPTLTLSGATLEPKDTYATSLEGVEYHGATVRLVAGGDPQNLLMVRNIPGGSWKGTVPAASLHVGARRATAGDHHSVIHWTVKDAP